MSWNIIVIIICLLLAAFAVYREYAREARAYLGWRIVASLSAVIALACFILPVTYPGKATVTTGPGKILLTDGYDKDSIAADKTDSVYTLDKAIHQQYPKARLLDDAAGLFKDSAHPAPVHVYGFGLGDAELAQLNNLPLSFHPSPVPDGFVAANWTEKVKAGQTFTAQGQYKNTSTKTYKLLLKGLNTTLDSASIPANTTTPFTLNTIPKSGGRAVYTLVVLNSKDTLQQEHLPVIVDKTQPLKVLILSASPDFESKFLKTWLSDNAYGVASRTSITKDKFSQEYVNMDQPDLTHITPALLGKFDVLVGDLSLLKSLSPAENGALQQEVMQKGMGVIIRSDSSGKAASWLQIGFGVTTIGGKQAANATLIINGKGKTAPLMVDPTYVNPSANSQTLVSDDHTHTLAAIAMSGAGKLVFSAIGNSHNWMLAGDKDDYTALWSLLINKAARKAPVTENWFVSTGIPAAGKPVELILENASAPGAISINKTAVYPTQNLYVPFQQSLTYWPATYGW
jgi:hypothetical protein